VTKILYGREDRRGGSYGLRLFLVQLITFITPQYTTVHLII